MRATHEHEWEASPGLPEPLPQGEKILWQGAPNWYALAVHAFHVRKVAIYFGLMMAWQAVSLRADGKDGVDIALALIGSGTLVLVALSLLGISAWWAARTSLYTLTDKRLVMRVGIVLSLTFNFPLRCIRTAQIRDLSGDHADIALELPPGDRIGWFHLWPHQRAWHLSHPQPTLRCVPQGRAVGELLQRTWMASQVPGQGRAQAASTTVTQTPGSDNPLQGHAA
ncbi:MAG: hypothetical protein RL657_577 [Pseudomonadota bacterium]